MPANLSLIFNLLLLAGIVVAISRVVRQRRKSSRSIEKEEKEPSLGLEDNPRSDDIIAVRRVLVEEVSEKPEVEKKSTAAGTQTTKPQTQSPQSQLVKEEPQIHEQVNDPVMLFLVAKKNRQFAGYELLQALLASGLRFGENNLFHRHQGENGQGILMCSLAAATESGQFNLSRIGAFTCRGLCLFLEPSHNSSIDQERFSVMLEIAEQLVDELDAHLLDEQRNPFDERSLSHYERRLGCELSCEAVE